MTGIRLRSKSVSIRIARRKNLRTKKKQKSRPKGMKEPRSRPRSRETPRLEILSARRRCSRMGRIWGSCSKMIRLKMASAPAVGTGNRSQSPSQVGLGGTGVRRSALRGSPLLAKARHPRTLRLATCAARN
jgi:hypothetical protein